MVFNNASAKTYSSGDLFLGLDETGREIGMFTDRHAITIAGSRSGKGAALIIPNLRRWPHNTLVIDPKGENVEHTWQDRQQMGQAVYVLDPFEVENVPPHLRVAFNPLDMIDPDSLSAAEDIEAIADGLVKRSDPKYSQWDNGAASLLAGIIAYVLTIVEDKDCTLTTVCKILQQSDDELANDAAEMVTLDNFDGLVRAAGNTIQTAFKEGKSMDQDFLGDARKHAQWLSRKPAQNVLSHSSFDLRELKEGKASLFLVLPPHRLDAYGVFLRLFVRCALDVMAKGGSGKGQKCLFILDEFYSLGKLSSISTACGLMPSYGVHLWPFLQDLGQLWEHYGKEGAQTFFGNADAHIFFGLSDPETLEHVSKRIGFLTPQEIVNAPPVKTIADYHSDRIGNESFDTYHKRILVEDENNQRLYQHKMALSGKPRIPPEKIKQIVAKSENNPVANTMIVFGKSDHLYNLHLSPYFRKNQKIEKAITTMIPESPPLVFNRFSSYYSASLWIIFALSPLWAIIIMIIYDL